MWGFRLAMTLYRENFSTFATILRAYVYVGYNYY